MKWVSGCQVYTRYLSRIRVSKIYFWKESCIVYEKCQKCHLDVCQNDKMQSNASQTWNIFLCKSKEISTNFQQACPLGNHLFSKIMQVFLIRNQDIFRVQFNMERRWWREQKLFLWLIKLFSQWTGMTLNGNCACCASCKIRMLSFTKTSGGLLIKQLRTSVEMLPISTSKPTKEMKDGDILDRYGDTLKQKIFYLQTVSNKHRIDMERIWKSKRNILPVDVSYRFYKMIVRMYLKRW